MIATESKEIVVFSSWAELKRPVLMGRLYVSRLRGNELFQFEYDPNWLQSEFARQVDPELGLFNGRHYPAGDRKNFGVFLDSMPDRWGRQLMIRREAILARQQNRKVRLLSDSDFLLGVYDLQRSGALRFQLSGENRFLNDDNLIAVPPWSSLRELEHASMAFEQESDEAESLASQWINILLAPGSSLGGARPKAGVIDQEGNLWIAKFPGRNDDADAGAWEFSPAYDMNPNPYGTGLRLNISESDNSLDVELAFSVAPFFRLDHNEAKEMKAKISKTVSSWRKLADNLKISKNEQDLMSAAFSQ